MATTTQWSSLSLSLLLLSIALFQTLTPNSSPSPPPPNYIVAFSHYAAADRHRAYLESALRPGGWRWIPRQNPAAQFPTDFGLVAIDDSAVVDEIRKLGSVKYVSLDMSYKRGLMTKKDQRRNDNKVGAFEDGKKKRPGKIFTAMSFSEAEEEDASNRSSSVKWGRELLMQVKYFWFSDVGYLWKREGFEL